MYSSLRAPLHLFQFSAMNSSSSAATTTTTAAPTPLYNRKNIKVTPIDGVDMVKKIGNSNGVPHGVYGFDPSFMKWTLRDVVNVAKRHWLPCFLGLGLLFFMGVEYTLRMVPASSPPFDLGFVATRRLHLLLSSWPELNTLLAALNTVGMFYVYTFLSLSFSISFCKKDRS